MGKGAFLFNALAKRYAKTPIADMVSYEKKLELTRKYLGPESEAFEFGCGTGSTALLHAPYLKHIHGIDYARNMVAIANEKCEAESIKNASFAVGDIDSMAVEPARYDVVLGLNIVHLLEDKPSALAKVFEMLRPGGYFISSTPILESFDGIWGVVMPLFRAIPGLPNVETMSQAQLSNFVAEAGFQEVERWSHGSKMIALFLVAQKPA